MTTLRGKTLIGEATVNRVSADIIAGYEEQNYITRVTVDSDGRWTVEVVPGDTQSS